MAWWHAVVDSRHELQNPTSPEKILLLGEALGLDESSRVLDIGAGRGGPAVLLAREFGCRILCVEPWREFADAIRERAQAAGVGHLVEVVESKAQDFEIEAAGFDAALCIGATFAFDGLVPTVEALARASRSGVSGRYLATSSSAKKRASSRSPRRSTVSSPAASSSSP